MIFFSKLLLRLIRMNNAVMFGITLLFIAGSSWLAFALEPETFQTPFNGLWWVMTTVTTVGYGDFYPHTASGKCLGMLLYLFGIGLISVIISKIIDAMFLYQRLTDSSSEKLYYPSILL
ncbi:two pore domain potassium channel family protein [Paenibacillus frigoriresistens]|uniref:potassium channel family protein n=1 Tax=Paenibacillus alginolyticus TaxID=59839 RepID=UPI001567209B|nr:potassium channel family protein [Paenibacillus frigoriresistens]NRF91014.1 two pore domain potassium channel family protein [Paenibacillus frigoriresistens]